MLNTIIAAAALAATSTAFLVPPGVANVAEASTKHPITFGGVDPTSQTLKLACPGCPYPDLTAKGELAYKDDIENSLVSSPYSVTASRDEC